MKTKNLPLGIFLFSLPLIASNLLQVLFNMADVAVIGRFAGSVSLAAVGSTVTAVTLFTALHIGFGGGINALAARYIGASDTDRLKKTVHTALILSLFLGVLVLLFGLFGSRALLELLGTKEELLDKASLYMRIFFLGMPALAVYNFGAAVYSAAGNTKKPLFYLLSGGVCNVILNIVFVVVCRLDVAGVALASAISQYLSATLVIVTMIREKSDFALKLSALRLSKREAGEILSLGVPAALQNAVFYVANLFIQAGVNTFDTVTVAGNSAAANADGLVYDVMAAFYIACSSFIGRAYGAGEKKKIVKICFICLAYSFLSGAILGLSLVAAGPAFLSLFTSDGAVIAEGMKRLSVMGLSYAISAFMDNALAASRGVGQGVVPMIFVILGSCVFRIVWIYTVFAHFGTLSSLYLLYVFSWTLTAIPVNVYFARCLKKIKEPVEAPAKM